MAETKWERREKKLAKRKRGMRISGRSIFTLQEILRRKGQQAKREREPKQTESQDE
jgi:hypothetical protein